jgi:LPS-assembly lipoprotein
MSSFNLKGLARVALLAGLSAGLSVGLSGCFRPLYGPTASGESLQTTLASIEVPEVEWPNEQARIGHYLRSELVYALNGSGMQVPKRYVLKLSLRQTLSTPIVDAESGRASSAIVNGVLTYTLTSPDGSRVIERGTATSSASYDRFQQRFATVRAARDAEIRLARVLAEQVRTRLSAALSSGG